MLTTMNNLKEDMLQTLITGAVGPEPIYKNRLAPIQSQWIGCGSESVPISVISETDVFISQMSTQLSVSKNKGVVKQ